MERLGHGEGYLRRLALTTNRVLLLWLGQLCGIEGSAKSKCKGELVTWVIQCYFVNVPNYIRPIMYHEPATDSAAIISVTVPPGTCHTFCVLE